jgi:cysteine desulfurase
MNHSPVYLDHAATTMPDPAVLERMTRCLTEAWNNPSSGYTAAGLARKELRLARQALADLLHARQEELVFTSGGTEANALALWQAAGKHVVLSAVEHPSVLENARGFGCRVTLVQPDQNGVITPEAVEAAIQPDTALVSIQYANNETGVIHSIAQISKIAKAHKLLFHVDAVQAVGQIPLDAETSGADMISVSAHKLYGPRGAGCLYVRRGTRIHPLLSGGGQENNLRSGTENLAGISAFGCAVEEYINEKAQRLNTIKELNSELRKNIAEICPYVLINSDNAFAPHILSISVPGIRSEIMLRFLSERGIFVSAGSACSSKNADNRVLSNFGIDNKRADSTLRISFSKYNSKEETLILAKAINEGNNSLIHTV